MKKELKDIYRLLSLLVNKPCNTKEEVVAWRTIADELEAEIPKNWEWLTGAENHEIQHFMIDATKGCDKKVWRQDQRDLMLTFLQNFETRDSIPPN